MARTSYCIRRSLSFRWRPSPLLRAERMITTFIEVFSFSSFLFTSFLRPLRNFPRWLCHDSNVVVNYLSSILTLPSSLRSIEAISTQIIASQLCISDIGESDDSCSCCISDTANLWSTHGEHEPHLISFLSHEKFPQEEPTSPSQII